MAWSDLIATRDKLAESAVDVYLVRRTARLAGPNAPIFWIDDLSSGGLQDAGLTSVEAVMSLNKGRRLRKLADRENWYLPGRPGFYLKKHRVFTWATRLAALFRRPAPSSAGRIEAENALTLEGLGIPVMRVVGFGERLLASGCQESFLLSEELVGYRELQDFMAERFKTAKERSWRNPDLQHLIAKVAGIARRFHAAGYNHRDFYTCHFLVRETSPGKFDMRLIDLQRAQHRTAYRYRWIVKDLAQLASMLSGTIIGSRGRVLFMRHYFNAKTLQNVDRNELRDIVVKEASIRERERRKS